MLILNETWKMMFDKNFFDALSLFFFFLDPSRKFITLTQFVMLLIIIYNVMY